jgi:hypothetical protein
MDPMEVNTQKPLRSYASTLLNPVRSFLSHPVENLSIGAEDYTITDGKHGPNLCFSELVDAKLDLEWSCSVIVKLMGRPNSENAYKFMWDGLNRKWSLKGRWQLIDLLNSFYAVKFQLAEDMEYALCNGPWIIAGQTLVVQKWRPEFDPAEEKISRMVVWVRINGLPLKYFKQSAMEIIGGMIGRVVKIDQHTLAQARGKFCRVCVEIDLDKPLKPFVEINSKPYGVVYEGISTICFNCGVYGHVKNHCPFLSEAVPNVDNGAGQTESVNMNMETANEVPIPTDVDKQGAPLERQNMLEVNKDDMGPWMVMSYKTQKKNTANNVGMKGKKTSGSRFAPLQTEDENIENHLTNSTPNLEAGTKTSEPKIVKFWKQVQEKTHIALSKGQPMEKNENHAVSRRVSSSSRTPLQEISNAKNSGTKSSRPKMKGPANNGGNFDAANSLATSTTVHGVPKPVFSDLNSPLKFSRNADDASTSFGATFGHVPPDETQNVEASVCEMMINVETDNQITFGSEPTEQVLATSQNTLPSSMGEDMVVS